MAKGDHIKVKRYFVRFAKPIRIRRLDYWHHGIDCGDGTVIHYVVGRSMRRATIRRTSMSRFLGKRVARVVHHQHSYPADEVIKRAESRLGRRGYNLIFNNCEHFANWCKTGDRTSEQVDNVTNLLEPNVSLNIVPATVTNIPHCRLAKRKNIKKQVRKASRHISRIKRKIS